MEFYFMLIAFSALFSCSKEVPIRGSTFAPELISVEQYGVHYLDFEKLYADHSKVVTEAGLDNLVDKFNNSQQLTVSSTRGYESWWYMTTKRPRLSLKDFPGRPGVATWREIRPDSTLEKRKNPKSKEPTAAGVSSGSWSFSPSTHFIQMVSPVLCIMFLLTCSCWI